MSNEINTIDSTSKCLRWMNEMYTHMQLIPSLHFILDVRVVDGPWTTTKKLRSFGVKGRGWEMCMYLLKFARTFCHNEGLKCKRGESRLQFHYIFLLNLFIFQFSKYDSIELGPMFVENRQLVTNEPVEFEK